jgi:hypothetical protein
MSFISSLVPATTKNFYSFQKKSFRGPDIKGSKIGHSWLFHENDFKLVKMDKDHLVK